MDVKQSNRKDSDLKESIPPRRDAQWKLRLLAVVYLVGPVLLAYFNLLPVKLISRKEYLEGWRSVIKTVEPPLRTACHNLIPGCPPPSYQRSERPSYWSKTQFDWESIKPSSKLEYSQCFRDHYCARLEVPLDWNSTDPEGPKAAIAIVKRPAIVDVTDRNYGGAILLNPGGPGGSGVAFLLAIGEALQQVVDSRKEADFNSGFGIEYHDEDTWNKTYSAETKDARYFDLISFDPRGVNNSIPYIPGITDPGRFGLWRQRLLDIGGSFENEEVFGQIYDILGLYGQVVSSSEAGLNGEDHHPAKYVTTASVVRDMIEIVERHGEWREGAAKKVIDHDKRYYRGYEAIQPPYKDILKRTAWKKGEEKLQYWGFSYGTVIGQTLATMYPERVGRMVLDGVVNITDYYHGGWRTDLTNTEEINVNFTKECAAVGATKCKFAEAQRNEDEHLSDRFYRLLASLKTSPITGLVNESPVFVSQYLILNVLFSLWYSGYFGYTGADGLLWAAAQDNASFFGQFDQPPRCPSSANATANDIFAAGVAINCADSDSKLNETRAEYRSYISFVNALSPTFGNVLAPIMMPCHGFRLSPTYRYAGPFGAHTANPILLASQTLDPVTPLRSADGAAALFPGSQVVEAQGIGHSTLGYPNLCAIREIRAYFRTGKVPQQRTNCAPALKPFQPPEALLQVVKEEQTLADRHALASAVEIATAWPLDGRGRRPVQLPNWQEAYWFDREREAIGCGNPLIEHRKRMRAQYGVARWH